ncbi:uncharacterized protein HD556DRAFT_1525379 [Suillus plorans]|uniref:Uncharacterized protein n=1 Tax=Suillus plorans TaxID=116603 RepID=A0A9P7DMZ7_9AGAM|nr:uncharacterized protein HD556DRAFT_1525379 [Suillus plorans]KAG1798873.1 hypothetical protein HD556DRAFT_1525379 [Suillus plorans]
MCLHKYCNGLAIAQQHRIVAVLIDSADIHAGIFNSGVQSKNWAALKTWRGLKYNLHAARDTSTTPAAKFSVRWETRELDRTDALVQFLDTHPADCCMLFNESKKSRDPAISEPDPSGSQKNHIWAAIAEVIFEKDEEYKDAYAEDKHKFTVAVSNCITHLRNKYKKQCARFHQTGAGINPLDAAGAQNLRAPTTNLLFTAPKTISSVPGVDHAANMAALTQGKGKQMVAQAPSPDPDNIVGDTESDIIDDILDEPLLAQGKGKEKALPPPCPDEPMDKDLNPNDDHTFITQPEPPLPSTPLNDANDDGEPRDDNFGPSNQEDEDNVRPTSALAHPHHPLRMLLVPLTTTPMENSKLM